MKRNVISCILVSLLVIILFVIIIAKNSNKSKSVEIHDSIEEQKDMNKPTLFIKSVEKKNEDNEIVAEVRIKNNPGVLGMKFLLFMMKKVLF